MRIYDFSSTLNFAVTNLNDPDRDVFQGFEEKFDEKMMDAAAYIRKLYEEASVDGEITEEEFKDYIIDDYDRILDQTYRSTDIYALSMKYIAVKYLEEHRSEIPALREEIIRRGLVYSEEEAYTDNFHENLLIVLLDLEKDFEIYVQNMSEINGEFLEEIKDFENKYGKEEGFKKYCEKYSNMKSINMVTRRHFINYAYLSIFGIEGSDVSLSEKSPVMKNKRSFAIREYVSNFADRIEADYREELVKSIMSLAGQLDRFGLLIEYRDEHARKMRDLRLPGLKYTVTSQELREKEDRNITEDDLEKSNNPSVFTLLSEKELSKLPLDVLLRMNSFYNNRLAKVVQSYALCLFILEEIGATMFATEGKYLSKDSIDKSLLDTLLLKFEIIRLPIKRFYEVSQRNIENDVGNFKTEDIVFEDGEESGKQAAVLNMNDFARDMKRVWKKEYETYFDKHIPNISNNLKQDILFINKLYNPIFLSYRFKNLAMKSEYAYMHYLSQTEPKMVLNFGLVLPRGQNTIQRTKNVFVASDGGLNFANRLHTIANEYIDFIIAYTGSPLIRLYEGIEDFDYFADYTTAQLLLPITNYQLKYLKELKKGKKKDKETTKKVAEISLLHSGNEALVEHIIYSAERTTPMLRHRVPVISYDKKGNPVTTYIPKVRYWDSRNGKIYTLNEYGKLVGTDGTIIEMNGEKVVNTVKCHDE